MNSPGLAMPDMATPGVAMPGVATPVIPTPGVAPLEPLAELRGYHWPDPVGWWPPAPGWWLLALVVLALLTLLGWWALRIWRRGAAARAALVELAALNAAYARDGDSAALARGLSRLLRRFALTRFPRRAVAGLSGEAWLAFLDTQGGGGRFLAGPGRLLVEAPYRPPGDLAVDELVALVAAWIRYHRRRGGGRP